MTNRESKIKDQVVHLERERREDKREREREGGRRSKDR